MTGLCSIKARATESLATCWFNTHKATLESRKKLPLVGIVAVEFEIVQVDAVLLSKRKCLFDSGSLRLGGFNGKGNHLDGLANHFPGQFDGQLGVGRNQYFSVHGRVFA